MGALVEGGRYLRRLIWTMLSVNFLVEFKLLTAK